MGWGSSLGFIGLKAARIERIFTQSGVDPRDPTVRALIALTAQILGFPRHLSQHVGGFVLTRGPLCEVVPIGNAAMEDRTFIEWDKDDIDFLRAVSCAGATFCVAQKNRAGSEYRATFENAIHMVDLLRWYCGVSGYPPAGGADRPEGRSRRARAHAPPAPHTRPTPARTAPALR